MKTYRDEVKRMFANPDFTSIEEAMRLVSCTHPTLLSIIDELGYREKWNEIINKPKISEIEMLEYLSIGTFRSKREIALHFSVSTEWVQKMIATSSRMLKIYNQRKKRQ